MYYNKKEKFIINSDSIRTTMLGDYYSYISKKNIKPFTDIKYKDGEYYLKDYDQYKYDSLNDLIVNFYSKLYNDLIVNFYSKLYPGYLTIIQPKSYSKYETYIYLESDFIKMAGDVQKIDRGNNIVICDDGKYYCTYDIGEFYPSVFWEVTKYENNSKKEI